MLVRLVSPSAQGVNMYSLTLSVSLAYMLPWRRLMSWRIQNGALNNPLREWRSRRARCIPASGDSVTTSG